jgi:hypothetical protein
MLTYATHLQSVIEKLIREEIDTKTKMLVSAHQSLDFADYKHHVGVVQGLERALELVEEAESVANQG